MSYSRLTLYNNFSSMFTYLEKKQLNKPLAVNFSSLIWSSIVPFLFSLLHLFLSGLCCMFDSSQWWFTLCHIQHTPWIHKSTFSHHFSSFHSAPSHTAYVWLFFFLSLRKKACWNICMRERYVCKSEQVGHETTSNTY